METPRPSQPTLRRTAYTLIEALVVIVLMGLIASLVLPALASRSQRAKHEQFVSSLIRLDTRARQLAQRHTGAIIEYKSQDRLAVLSIIGTDGLHQTDTLQWPENAMLELQGFGQGDEQRVRFDQLGQSVDYTYEIRFEPYHARLSFNGLSGWYELVDESGND